MTDRDILFQPDMVRAIIADRKSMTRRGLRLRGFKTLTEFGRSDTPGYHWHFRDDELRWHDLTHDELLARLPYQVGDRLWVREEHYRLGHWETDGLTRSGQTKWRFMGDNAATFDPPPEFRISRDPQEPGRPQWYRRLGRFLFRHHARLTLTVTAVRVERLQDIPEADAIAEGLDQGVWSDVIPMLADPTKANDHAPDTPIYWAEGDDGNDAICLSARDAFSRLWQRLHGPEAWELNPWVAVYGFRKD